MIKTPMQKGRITKFEGNKYCPLADSDGRLLTTTSLLIDKADQIIRAVNNEQALVEALKLIAKYGPYQSINGHVIDHANNVLKQLGYENK